MSASTNLIATRHNVKRASRKENSRNSLFDKYMSYVSSEKQEQVYWFLKAIIILPCVIMVPAIMAMHAAIENHVPFVGVCMVLFFLNVIVHIAEVKSKYYISIYHVSILIMILAPLFAFLINS